MNETLEEILKLHAEKYPKMQPQDCVKLLYQREFMCSPDLAEFIRENHLDLSLDGTLNPRDAFGSHSDSDHEGAQS